jgi:hypothetical protein
MNRRVVLETLVYPLMLGVPPFAFVWVKYGGMTLEWALEMIVLSLLLVVSTALFLARILEKHGYRKSDIKRLFDILEKHWEEPWDCGYLKHDVQYCIVYHLLLWGFLSVALLEFQDVSLVIMAVAGLVFLLAAAYPIAATMIAWVLVLPLYFLKDERTEDGFGFVGKTSLLSTLAIPAIWVASTHLSTGNYPEQILKMFNAVVVNAEKFWILSVVNTLFGFMGRYLVHRIDRKVLTAVSLALAFSMLFIVWSIFAG